MISDETPGVGSGEAPVESECEIIRSKKRYRGKVAGATDAVETAVAVLEVKVASVSGGDEGDAQVSSGGGEGTVKRPRASRGKRNRVVENDEVEEEPAKKKGGTSMVLGGASVVSAGGGGGLDSVGGDGAGLPDRSVSARTSGARSSRSRKPSK